MADLPGHSDRNEWREPKSEIKRQPDIQTDEQKQRYRGGRKQTESQWKIDRLREV